jgi:CHAD domain-containing protein
VLEKGAKIRRDSRDAELHRLRIHCKKLRYLLEFFRNLFAPSDLESLVKALKGLQDSLGTFNDLGIQQQNLINFGREMTEEQSVAPESLIAIDRLVEGLAVRQKRERTRFERRMAEFSGRETTERIERVLQSVEKGKL